MVTPPTDSSQPSPLEESGQSIDSPPVAHPITIRAVVVGIVCVALVCVLVTWAELILSATRIGYLQLPPVTIGLLLVLVAAVRGFVKFGDTRLGLNASEQVTVYVMALVGAMVSSHGIVQKLIPLMVVPNYAANHNNNWANIFFAHVPKWIVPWDPHGGANQPVAKSFYEKLPDGAPVPWGAWLEPLIVWGTFLGLIVWAFLCLTTILRKQWLDNEKLAFPLAQLPLDIIQQPTGSTSFWRTPAVWMGIAVPVVYYGINWVHQFVPATPLLPTSISVDSLLLTAGRPWNQLDYTPLIFSFAALGFFYLLPTDILLSIWLFFLLTRGEQMLAVMVNMDTPRMPTQNVYLFQGYQTIGAYFVLTAYFVSLARPHLAAVWREATFRERSQGSASDMMSYRSAFWGLVASLVLAAIMLVAMGMSPLFAALEIIGAVLVIGVVMARSTAEAGMLMTEVTWSPVDIVAMFGSIHGLGAANLTIAPFVDHLLVHDQRGLLLTGMLDSARLGDGVQLDRKALLGAIVVGIVVAVAVAVPLQVYLPYTYGGLKMDYWMESLSPQTEFTRYAAAMAPGGGIVKDPWQMPVFFIVGVLTTTFLVVMRSTFYWWPLHPLGYALAGAWSTIQFWFPCLLAWMFKSVSIRYGGMSLYTKLRPFFLGLVIGEFGMAVFTVVLSVIVFQASHQTYHLPIPGFPWE